MNMEYIKIFEEYKKETRTKSISIYDAVKIYKEHCYNWDLNEDVLFRGSYTSTDFTYGHGASNEHELRSSANNYNIYTSLFPHIPSWHKAPRRDKSFIMSTNYNIASQYNNDDNVIVMVPYNNTKIGICPDSDIWDTELDIINSKYILEEFDSELSSFFKNNIKHINIHNITADNIMELLNKIDSIPKDKLILSSNYGTDIKYPFELATKWVKEYSHLTLLDFLKLVLDFDYNGFKIGTTQKSIENLNNNEVWSNGEFLGIRLSKIDEFLSLINN